MPSPLLDRILNQAPFFLLAAARCFALLSTLPLFSMRTIPGAAKVALAGYMAYFILPQVNFSSYEFLIGEDGVSALNYILVLAGEILIGVINGFYVTVIFAAFSTAGQFFAFQMGFSASEVYDSMSQVENPLMGQYFNLIAMLIFLQGQWAQRLFLGALVSSFKSLNCFLIVNEISRRNLVLFMVSGLTDLFTDALIIALPLMGTLLLVSVSVGLLSKAAPQMNLLSEGFPVMMLLSFFIITAVMPSLCDFFDRSFVTGFIKLERLFVSLSGGGL
ncbi:flagellar biosynthetic protein FliR [Treponema parvum]|uniref:flagellar biosynthetic protein FliR n=1 Tax=Treponema parvum TaxID=138851 RepID=UPI002116D30B|nr:flagellar biosynthetic protein FliR [Treponema parvum]